MIVNLACGVVQFFLFVRNGLTLAANQVMRCESNNVYKTLQLNSKLRPPRRLGQMLLGNQAPSRLRLLHHILEANADATAFGVLVLADVNSGLVGKGEAGEKLLLDVS